MADKQSPADHFPELLGKPALRHYYANCDLIRRDEPTRRPLPERSEQDVRDIKRSRAYTFHKNAGTLPEFYAQYAGAPLGYFDQLDARRVDRKPGRGRGGR